MSDLPPDFWPTVFDIDDAGWHWPPLYQAWERRDPLAAAREARHVALLAIADHATKQAERRANAGSEAAKARARNPRNRARGFLKALSDYEDATGLTITLRTSASVRNQVAAKIGTSPDHLRTLLKKPERNRKRLNSKC